MFRTFIFDSNNKLLVKGDLSLDDGNSNLVILQSDNDDVNSLKVIGNVKASSNIYALNKLGIQTSNPIVGLEVNTNDAILISKGTTEERPSIPVSGHIRYNTDTSQFEGFGAGDAWGSLGGVKSTDQLTFVSAEQYPTSNDGNIRFINSNVETMRITSMGNVGISTSNPTERLEIKGNTKMSSNLYIMNALGIQTSNPTVGLEVKTTDAILISKGTTEERPSIPVSGHIRYNTDTSQFEGFGAGDAWGSLGGVKSTDQLTFVSAEQYPTSNDGNIRFINSNVETMRITSMGNVGIGKINPTVKVDVVGDVRASNLIATRTLYTSNLSASNISTSNFASCNINVNSIVTSNIVASNLVLLNQSISTANVVAFLDVTTSNVYSVFIFSSNVETSNLYSTSKATIGHNDPSSVYTLDVLGSTYISGETFLSNDVVIYGVSTLSNDVNVVGNIDIDGAINTTYAITGPTITLLSNLGVFSSNTAISASNTTITLSNYVFGQNISNINWASNTAISASNTTITLSNYVFGQNISNINWASNTAVSASNTTITLSNYVFGQNTSNINWASNTAISASNTTITLSNYVFGQNTSNINWTSNTAVSVSNTTITLSNYVFGQNTSNIDWASNTAISASNTTITLSNYVFGQNTSNINWASNTAVSASNTTITLSNYVFGQNTSNINWASNTAVSASNTTITLSNYVFGQNISNINWASNTAVSASNIAYWSSNSFVRKSGDTITGNLRVNGDVEINGTLSTINTDVRVTDIFTVSNDGTGPALNVYQFGAQPIADFYDDSNVAMRIANNGNVGIGTSNPLYKLDIVGNVNVSTTITGPTITSLSNLGVFSSNTAISASNNTIALSNYVYGINTTSINWASNTAVASCNAAIFGSNTSVNASNNTIALSNYVYGTNTTSINWASNTAVASCNAAIFGSNTSVNASNNTIALSNYVYGINTTSINWASNTAVASCNAAIFGSNANVSLSNYVYGGSNATNTTNTTLSNLVKKSGDTMTGDLTISNAKLITSIQSLGSSNDSSTIPSFSFLEDSNTGIFHSCNDTIGFAVGGIEAGRIDVNGMTVASNLIVGSNLQMTNRLVLSSLKVTRKNGLDVNVTSTSVRGYSNASYGVQIDINSNAPSSNQSFRVTWSNNNELMRVTGDGNVGIGTTTPAYKLDVNGDINFTGAFRQNGTPYVGSQWKNNSSNVFLTGSNVGIGTTSPSYPLDVGGNVNIGALSQDYALTSGGQLTIWANRGGSNSYAHLIYAVGSNNQTQGEHIWYTRGNGISGAQRMKIASDGNVGIGTPNPTYKLDVNGDINFTGAFRQNGMPYIGSQWSNNTSNVFLIGSNVGIGTSNPGEKLEINGGKIYTTSQVLGNSNDTVITPSFSFKEDSNTGIFHSCNDTIGFAVGGIEAGRIDVNGMTVASNLIVGSNLQMTNRLVLSSLKVTRKNGLDVNVTSTSIRGYSNASYGVQIDINSNAQSSNQSFRITWSNNNELMRVTGDGNVGIGTSNPTYKLDVNGDINFTGAFRQNGTPYIGSQWSNNTSNVFLIGSNVGIGTSNPAYKLDVNGDINFTGAFRQNGTPYIGSQWSNNTSNVFLIGSNVGIGTSNPAYKLDVNGDINFTGAFRQNGTPYIGSQWSNNTSNVFLIGSNVGIGTSNPAYKLDVNGDINFTGAFRQNGTPYIGSQWSNNTSNVFLIGSNVGIGTSNPGEKLEINGGKIYTTSQVLGNSNDTVITPSFSFKEDSNTGIFHSCNDTIGFAVGGIEAGRIDVNGMIVSSNLIVGSNLQITNRLVLSSLKVTRKNGLDVNVTSTSIRGYSNASYGVQIDINSNAPSLNQSFRVTWSNNNELMRVTGNGNVGIGTTTPSAKLEVAGDIKITSTGLQIASDNSYIIIDDGVTDRFGFIKKSGMGAAVACTSNENVVFGALNSTSLKHVGVSNFSEHMRIVGASGNVGIGTTSPSAKLHVNGTTILDGGSKIVVQNGQDGGSGRGIYMWTGDDNNWGIYMAPSGALKSLNGGTAAGGSGFTSHAIRFRVNNSSINGFIFENGSEQAVASIRGSDGLTYFAGNVGIGVTDPTYKLHVNGNIYATGDIIAFSDMRFKSNLEMIINPLDKVSQLTGYTYDLISATNSEKTKISSRYTGLVAQDLQKVLPEAVHQDINGNLSVAYGNMAGLFVEAIKELAKENTLLKEKLISIEYRLSKLEDLHVK